MYCKRVKIRWAKLSCFSWFSGVPRKFSRDYKCLSLIILNNEYLCTAHGQGNAKIFPRKFWWYWNREYLAQRIFPHLRCLVCLQVSKINYVFVKMGTKVQFHYYDDAFIKQEVLLRCYCYTFIGLPILLTVTCGSTAWRRVDNKPVHHRFSVKMIPSILPTTMCVERNSASQHLDVCVAFFWLFITCIHYITNETCDFLGVQ